MKMSKELFLKLESEVRILCTKTDVKTLVQKILASGNSETRAAFDLFYMVQGHSKFRSELDRENLNDDHIKTAMVKIMKGVLNES